MDVKRPPIEHIEARLNATTPGPWHWKYCVHSRSYGDLTTLDDTAVVLAPAEHRWGLHIAIKKADADFIDRAKEDIAALLAYIRALEEVRAL